MPPGKPLSSEDGRSVNYTLTMPRSLMKVIDERRGLIPRSVWIKELVLRELKQKGLLGVSAPEAATAQIAVVSTTALSNQVGSNTNNG